MREVVLAARPVGEPAETDFEIRDAPDAVPGDGEVAIRNVFVSVDPYMRGRMTGIRTYVPPLELGRVVDGAAVGRVAISRDGRFAEGDWVLSMLGWREEGVASGNGLRRLDPATAPPSTALGVLGVPGLTAWVGLLDIARIEGGETVYVSGAAGAVGSAAAQIARLKGCRVIGSAGSAEKVAWLEELGIEAFDYRTTSPRETLTDGIDVYFDNVGGRQLEAALSALRDFGRVAACGAIGGYNDVEAQPGPRNLAYVVSKRLRIEGFIVLDHLDRFPDFVAEVGPWVREGKVQYRETILEGIDAVPRAFAGLFHGENVGKMLVRVGPEQP